MLPRHRLDFEQLAHVDIQTQTGIRIAMFECKEDRLRHAGIDMPFFSIQAKAEPALTREANHATIDHQNVRTSFANLRTDIRRAGDIADDRAGTKLLRLDKLGQGTGSSNNYVRWRQPLCGVATD